MAALTKKCGPSKNLTEAEEEEEEERKRKMQERNRREAVRKRKKEKVALSRKLGHRLPRKETGVCEAASPEAVGGDGASIPTEKSSCPDVERKRRGGGTAGMQNMEEGSKMAQSEQKERMLSPKADLPISCVPTNSRNMKEGGEKRKEEE